MNRGSVSELIDDGVTGFICSSVDEMATAVSRLDSIDPLKCRETAVNRFSTNAMIDSYEKTFLKIIGS
jgi:glycosyltransferase involved in cell wall biosynthesis